MRLCVPEYYEHFQCSASACQDNCCIGWEIDIDPESDRQYRQVGGAFGARLQASIRREGDTPCFRLAAEHAFAGAGRVNQDLVKISGKAGHQRPRFFA